MSESWVAAGDDVAPWRHLKGGELVGITKRGEDYQLDIEIPRIVRKLAGSGQTLCVRLKACTELVFQPFDEPPIEDPGAIIGSAPDIVAAEVVDGVGALAPGMKVVCASGELHLRYSELRVELPDSTPVSLDALASRAAVDDLPWSTPGGHGSGGAGAS